MSPKFLFGFLWLYFLEKHVPLAVFISKKLYSAPFWRDALLRFALISCLCVISTIVPSLVPGAGSLGIDRLTHNGRQLVGEMAKNPPEHLGFNYVCFWEPCCAERKPFAHYTFWSRSLPAQDVPQLCIQYVYNIYIYVHIMI